MVGIGMWRTIACLAFMITAPTGLYAIPEQLCGPGYAKACAQAYGWASVEDWPTEDLNKYIEALGSASQGSRYSGNNGTCDDIREAATNVLTSALALANDRETPGPLIYFYRGDLINVDQSINGDEGAGYIEARGLDATTGDTLIYYQIFIFDENLSQLGTHDVWDLLLHEVGHYLGIGHADSFNNYDLQACWDDVSEEEDDDPAGGGSGGTIIIRTTLHGICEWEQVTICVEAEDDSGEDVCWREWRLVRCYFT